MTKYKAVIRFLEEPMRIIKWFTKNFDKEIGALGIGELKDGIMVIERLVFPQQIVNGVHVHFKPEDWGPIVRDLSIEDFGKIIFYWHKHPGSAGASQGDEDDTFDVFMPEENCARPFFGFMQTAIKHNGDFEYEARIEMRDPIWTTIEDVEIMSDDDYSVEETCKKIIEDHITLGNASTSDQPGTKKTTTVKSKVWNKAKQKFEMDIPAENYDYDLPTFEVDKKNGNIKLTVSDYFEDWVLDVLSDEAVEIWVKKFKKIIGDTKITFEIQPNKKCINNLYDHFSCIEKEMALCNEEDPITEDVLEDTLNKDSVYSEEKDIKKFNERHGNPIRDRFAPYGNNYLY